ncbi:hypothetical protein NKJ55_22555 [Mesorhizobium sp. M0106]|uniref:hypothetical protein n=1 Tax=Mesorhizobium sp. M0106 TaxID=2956880 RepID=UPI003338251B
MIAAGILDVQEGRVRVLSPNAEAVAARVADNRTGKAEYWAGAGGAEGTCSARRACCYRRPQRAAGRGRHLPFRFGRVHHTSGPVLELLSSLAEEGEVETFAKAYGLFTTLRPLNAHYVRESVPAKISSRYLASHRRLDASKILAWASVHPDWPDQLKATLSKPALFALTVNAMANAIAVA